MDTTTQQGLHHFTSLLTQWAHHVGRGEIESCTKVVWVHKKGEAIDFASSSSSATLLGSSSSKKGMMVLVVDAIWSPKVQYVAPLCFSTTPPLLPPTLASAYVQFPNALPFAVSMVVGHPRMDKYIRKWRCVETMTSDELGMAMLEHGPLEDLAIQPLIWDGIPQNKSLLEFQITGIAPCFIPNKIKQQSHIYVPKDLDMENPFEHPSVTHGPIKTDHAAPSHEYMGESDEYVSDDLKSDMDQVGEDLTAKMEE